MITTETIAEAREVVKQWKAQGLSVGLAPTMGYLHAGHAALIARSCAENDKTAVSLFVNPIQFAPNEDFSRYPRDAARDFALCAGAGVDLVFAPSADEMYPAPPLAYADIDGLGDGLCGASRRGHFRGVCTVVAKLFHILTPDRAYFGQKDAQQLAIIKRMTRDLNFDIEIVPCRTVREADGLALSSRNVYLSPGERAAALALPEGLRQAEHALRGGERNAEAVRDAVLRTLAREPLARVDYAEVVDADSLAPVSEISKPVLVAAAVYIGKTRLIDNFTFGEV
ncbi:MAG: pantoate--beta-alanine ligase [Clostridiales bacterium]|nr:pantoate--beta-alanine ligase [Clostridiales bacterium]